MHQEEASESLKQVLYGGTIAFLVLSGFVIFFLLMFMRRKTKNILEKEQLRSEFQQELLQTQLEIQEQTLKTISQEIHDNIGQVLSLAKLNLNTMDITKQDKLQEKISDSKKLISKAIQDLRDLSRSMNTDNIEAIGLVQAIEYEMDMIRKTGFKTELNTEGSIIRLEPQKELILFRIIQEVLNNIIKHSEASAITAKISYLEKEIKIEVKDNGKGFDLTPLDKNETSGFGLGIRNMHNRAKLIGADFTMSSNIGEGTAVALTMPLNSHNL
jgi:two-component system, NarL family, sensor kinase